MKIKFRLQATLEKEVPEFDGRTEEKRSNKIYLQQNKQKQSREPPINKSSMTLWKSY